MTRVAANDVERLVTAAQSEVAAERRENKGREHSSDFAAIVAAFKRAAELSKQDYRSVALRGRKSGVRQSVIATTQRKSEAGHGYVLCLIPHAGRRPFKYTVERVEETSPGKTKSRTETVVVGDIIPLYHEQWVRDDRLEAA